MFKDRNRLTVGELFNLEAEYVTSTYTSYDMLYKQDLEIR